MSVLIFGANGKLGRLLSEQLGRRPGVYRLITTQATSPYEKQFNIVHQSPESLVSLRPTFAFFFAGVTNIDQCERSPRETRFVNEYATIKTIAFLSSRGVKVVWVSSSAVFSGSVEFPGEGHPQDPTCEYGRQKTSVERRLVDLGLTTDSVAVLRLSKVVFSNSDLVSRLRNLVKTKKTEYFFDDLMLSPISTGYVLNVFMRFLYDFRPGIFHFSGAQEMSYSAFCSQIGSRFGVREGLILGRSFTAMKAHPIVYAPEHPALGMPMTEKVFGIKPESFDSVADNLLAI